MHNYNGNSKPFYQIGSKYTISSHYCHCWKVHLHTYIHTTRRTWPHPFQTMDEHVHIRIKVKSLNHPYITILQIILITCLQCPPFKMSHMDQKVSTSLLPVTPSLSTRAQKYITSPAVFSRIVSSNTFSAFKDNEACFKKWDWAIMAITKKLIMNFKKNIPGSAAYLKKM